MLETAAKEETVRFASVRWRNACDAAFDVHMSFFDSFYSEKARKWYFLVGRLIYAQVIEDEPEGDNCDTSRSTNRYFDFEYVVFGLLREARTRSRDWPV